MRFRTWPVAALGLGALLVLVMFSVWTASRKAQVIFTQVAQLNDHHREVDAMLRRLRSDVHVSGIFVRDYLLDSDRSHAAGYRQQLSGFRDDSSSTLDKLAVLTRGAGTEERIAGLRDRLEDYWQTLEPLFDWTPVQKQTLSAMFLRREVLPKREAVLSIAQQIEGLNNDNMLEQRNEISRRYTSFRKDLDNLLWRTLLLGFAVALIPVFRLRVLERRSEQQRATAEEAERLMRDLSQQLVAGQEAERKRLSRELHDHVGQLLTALRMELGRIDRSRTADSAARTGLAECCHLVDNLVRVVRDLSLGLRPSMLDDLGLQPALEWLVRDASRRSAIDVVLSVPQPIERLDERASTCVYRAVQEALTNCIRHSGAKHVDVTITQTADALDVVVVDDGKGFDTAARSSGLGLRGMAERVKELGGSLAVRSSPGNGTTLSVRLPIVITQAEHGVAERLAG
jgi:signal transduction histidine kinase